MRIPHPVTIDFETQKIEGRPVYPPIPVGVAIKKWGKPSRYYGWGHPTKNNSTKTEAHQALIKIWNHKDGHLYQNGKFDADVAETHFKLKPRNWRDIHDTMFLLFLDDPHQTELGLKPSAARLLDWPADEQDAVMTWLLEHQPVPNVKLSKSKGSDNYWGGYISYAPGDLVGIYACGDTDRTEAIFKLLYQKTMDRGMLRAYEREQELMVILLQMERQGLPVDLKRLRLDVHNYQQWQIILDRWVVKRLNAPSDINLDSGDQLVSAMIAAGVADETKMPRTPNGKISTAKDSLLLGVTDKVLLAVLRYRTQLNTCLHTFMEPWLRTAEASRGLIFTNWNQTKQPSGDANVGTRTGRLSSNPNFQNLANEFKPIFFHERPKTPKGERPLPKCPINQLPSLPRVRSYIVPFKGEMLIDRDYSQQEPRLLGHFEPNQPNGRIGELRRQYLANHWMDVHDSARDELAKRGKHYERKPVKNTNLGLIYGMGKGKLALKNDMSVEEAGALKNAVLDLYPGLKQMYKDMKERMRTRTPIHTWGGREYFCEEPKLINGRIQQFDYKLVNVLIQGSAADVTKEAIIRFWRVIIKLKKLGVWRILLNVHDQLTVSVPIKDLKQAMEVLRQCMESVEVDIPMLTEGSTSLTNWAELKDYDKKGKLL